MKPSQYYSDKVVQQKRAILEQERSATQIISIHADKQVFVAVHEKFFGTFITKRLGRVYDCYIAEVSDNISCIWLLISIE